MLKFTVIRFSFLSFFFIISNGDKDLNFCPDPWSEYSIRATNHNGCLEECNSLCSGHAFYDDDSQLVCYNVAKTTSMISSPSVLDPTCECGLRILRHWFGNQNAEMVRSACIPDISKEPMVNGPDMIFQCKNRCESATAYLYRRSHLTYMVNCQLKPRVVMRLKPKCAINNSDFPNQSVWRCRCAAPSRDIIKASGIKNELIYPTRASLSVNSNASFEFFKAIDYNAVMENCPATGSFPMLEGETLYQCHARCDVKCRGWGFRHKNSLVCYHREKVAEKRSHFGKKDNVTCECGVSLTSQLYFDPPTTNTWKPCSPERLIFPDIPVSKDPEDTFCACKRKCAEHRAYTQIKGEKKVILCKHVNDYVPMKQPLSGRCSYEEVVKCKCCLPAHRPPRQLIEPDVILEDNLASFRTNISTHAANRLEFPQNTNQFGSTVYDGYSKRQTNSGMSGIVSEQRTGSSRSNSQAISHSSSSKRKMENVIGSEEAVKEISNHQNQPSSSDEKSNKAESARSESNTSGIPPKKQHKACLKNPTFVPLPPPIHPSIIAAEREMREKRKGKSGKRSTVEKSSPKPRGRAKKCSKPDILPTNVIKSPRSKRSPRNKGNVTLDNQEQGNNSKPASPGQIAERIEALRNPEHQNNPHSLTRRRGLKKANEELQHSAKGDQATSKSKRAAEKSTTIKETGTEINKENRAEFNNHTEKGKNAREAVGEGTANNINSPDVTNEASTYAPKTKNSNESEKAASSPREVPKRTDKQIMTENAKPKKRAPRNISGTLRVTEPTESEIARRARESSTSSDSQRNIPFQLLPVQPPSDQPLADQPPIDQVNLPPPPNKPKRAPRKKKTPVPTDQPSIKPKVKRAPRKKKTTAAPPPKPPKPTIPSNAEVINLEKPDSDLEIFDADCQVVNRPKTIKFRQRSQSSTPLSRTKSKNKQPIPPDQVINLIAESPPHPSRAQLRPQCQRESRRSNAHSSSSRPEAKRQSSPHHASQSSSDLKILDVPPHPSRSKLGAGRQPPPHHTSRSSSDLEILRTPPRASTSQPINERSHTRSASLSRSSQSLAHPTRSSPEPQSNPSVSSGSLNGRPLLDHLSMNNRRSKSPTDSSKTDSPDCLANIPDNEWLKLSLWGDSPSKGN